MEHHINVSVRLKPLSEHEETEWDAPSSSEVLSLRTKERYAFDRVFCSDTPTSTIFDEVVKGLVATAVQGINATVFAYGQTASGKTHTMRGVDQSPGIIPLSICELFKEVNRVKDRTFQVKVSYLELYNETINDLLVPANEDLEIRESLHGVYVKGLSEFDVSNPDQALARLYAGDGLRKVGETKLNEQSSRSHTVFRVHLESKPVDAMPTVPARVSQLNLIDLAGSEGVSKTKAEGVRLREGVNINRSLLALSNVIHRLSSSAGKFINFRDSKLTRMLQPALGGNSKTAIICTMSQLKFNYQETVNTLLFGVKAKRIKNSFKVNEVVPDSHKRLQLALREIKTLKDELRAMRMGKCEESRTMLESLAAGWQAKMEALRDMLVAREQETSKKSLIIQDFENMKTEFASLGKSLQSVHETTVQSKQELLELKMASMETPGPVRTLLSTEKKRDTDGFRLKKPWNFSALTPNDGDRDFRKCPDFFTSTAKKAPHMQDVDLVEQDGIKLLDIALPGEDLAPGEGGEEAKVKDLEKEVVRLEALVQSERKARLASDRERERIARSAEATLAESIEECEKLYSELNETQDAKEKTTSELATIRNELDAAHAELDRIRKEKGALEEKLKTMTAEMQRATEALPGMLEGMSAMQPAAPTLTFRDIPAVAQIMDKLRQSEGMAGKLQNELGIYKGEAERQRQRADELLIDNNKKAEMMALYQNNSELLKKEMERLRAEHATTSKELAEAKGKLIGTPARHKEDSAEIPKRDFASAKKELHFRGEPDSVAKRSKSELEGLRELVELKTRKLEECEKKLKILSDQRKVNLKEIEGLRTDKNALMLRVKTMSLPGPQHQPANNKRNDDPASLTALQLQLVEKSALISQLKKEKEADSAVVRQLQETVKTVTAEKEAGYTALLEKNDKIQQLEQENIVLKQKLEDSVSELLAERKRPMRTSIEVLEEEAEHHHVLKRAKSDVHSDCGSAQSAKDCPYYLRSRSACLSDDKENLIHHPDSVF